MKFSKNLRYVLFIATLLTLVETFGQTLLRKFYLTNKKNKGSTTHLYLPFITWLCYGVCVLLLWMSYHYSSEGMIEVFWNVGTNTLIPIAGFFFFGETLDPYGWIGIGLTTIGGFMLGRSQNNYANFN
tara:strand:- start:9971 stop:10354 length:384 start_codon:yes stop_codon:yes gene_type:complete